MEKREVDDAKPRPTRYVRGKAPAEFGKRKEIVYKERARSDQEKELVKA